MNSALFFFFFFIKKRGISTKYRAKLHRAVIGRDALVREISFSFRMTPAQRKLMTSFIFFWSIKLIKIPFSILFIVAYKAKRLIMYVSSVTFMVIPKFIHQKFDKGRKNDIQSTFGT